MPVNPTGADLKRFLAEDPGGPVVMLNLMRFKADGGREGYEQYITAFQPFLEKVGGHVVYLGDLSSEVVAWVHGDWDMVLLAWYPSREAFSAMVADPDYQKVTHLRTEALEEAILQGTIPLAAS